MKKNFKSKKSQVLVISIFAFILLFIFAFLVVETGNLIYWKIHLQNIADSAAMEGGTWYARALNLVSLSNKALFIIAAGGLVSAFITLGATAPAVEKAIRITQKIQDFFAGTGDFEKAKVMPALNAAAVVINGRRNEDTLCIPVFNVEDFDISDPLPSFNLKRRKISDFLSFDDDQKKNKYYYRKKSTGEKIYVDEKDVRKNRINWTIEKKTGKRLIKEKNIELPDELRGPLDKLKGFLGNLNIDFDIVETGEHTILVVAIKKDIKQLLNSDFFLQKNKTDKIATSAFISTSLVKVDGGKMDFWELDGASYTPKLKHIILPQIKIADKFSESSGQFTDFSGDIFSDVSTGRDINNILSFLSKSTQFLTDNLLLH